MVGKEMKSKKKNRIRFIILGTRKTQPWFVALFYRLLAICPWASAINSLGLSFIIYKVWKIISASTPHKASEGAAAEPVAASTRKS